QRGKFMNNTTGTSSTAAKFVSAFKLGAELFKTKDETYSSLLQDKALTAFDYAHQKLGVTQTVSVKSPYIYAEDNWVDDMELAYATMYKRFGKEKYLKKALEFKYGVPITPWLLRDTANHYQYFSSINVGHYELGKQGDADDRKLVLANYRN